jgi:hypothetical protein
MEEFGGSSLKSMIDELQSMVARLGERIEDRCSGLENRVESAEQRAEERLISLEMARVESKAGRADMEKRFDGLKLEVLCINKFMERESMENQQNKSGIFTTSSAAVEEAGGSSP